MALFSRRRREVDDLDGTIEMAEDDSLGVIEALFAPSVSPSALPSAVSTPVASSRGAAAHIALSGPTGLPAFPASRTPAVRVADSVPLDHDPALTDDLGRRSSPSRIGTETERARMAYLEQSVQDLLAIDGATGAAIVDSGSGMALAEGGHPGFDLGVAAAGNSNVVRAKLQTMRDLGLNGTIDDILITLDQQYHLINVLHSAGNEGLFVYLVLDRAKANLALARHKLTQVAAQIQV